MTDEPNDEPRDAAATGYWWCPNCKLEVGPHSVTHQEQHEACGHHVSWITMDMATISRTLRAESDLDTIKDTFKINGSIMDKMRDAAADLAVCEATTPGPWSYDKQECPPHYVRDSKGAIVAHIYWPKSEFDGPLMAMSRTALPYWIKRAEKAEAELREARYLLSLAWRALRLGSWQEGPTYIEADNAIHDYCQRIGQDYNDEPLWSMWKEKAPWTK